MNEKELAIRIVQLGIATQRQQLDKYTEANEDAAVRAAGNASIAASLEFLGKHSLVADAQPCLGTGGMGVAYRIKPPLLQEILPNQTLSQKN